MIPGGNSRKPFGKYVLAMNKITKDRYLPTGPEVTQSAQLYDITGDKMELLLDFPTIGEPHYAAGCPADLIKPKSKKIFKLDENKHKYAALSDADTKVVRTGNEVHVYMTMIRSHFSPDNIEGVEVGDKVYFHVTNLEQDYDVPHGISMIGANTSELLIMPGQTETFVWEPKAGWSLAILLYRFLFCTSPGNARIRKSFTKGISGTKLAWSLGEDIE